MKRCYKCKKDLPKDSFSKSSSRTDGLQTHCKLCSKEIKRQWIAGNRDKVAKNRLWSMFRLRPDDYDKLMKKQNSTCGICEEPFIETPHVDHDHNCCPTAKTCGKCVRGLLCSTCNKLLGGYEKMAKMPGLIKYLG